MKLREEVARKLCKQGDFDPDEMMPNDGPRWRYYLPAADAAIAIVLNRAERVVMETDVSTNRTGMAQIKLAIAIRALAEQGDG